MWSSYKIKTIAHNASYIFLLGIIAATLLACSNHSERISAEALDYGFTSQVIIGTDYAHQIYWNSPGSKFQSEFMHVYLEGDGSPWIRHQWVAKDPTPRNPLMLRLMGMDPAPSLYLGRPCYHGFADTPPCTPAMWTDARYSKEVVSSMAEVLYKLVHIERLKSLVFIGHSGGGTLAVLLAERFPETEIVITIAGNLDIDAWADMHNYTRLRGSLNPAKRSALDPRIHQMHLVGGRDKTITPDLAENFESRQQNSELLVISDFDHSCCWNRLWPSVLDWASVIEASDGMVRKDLQLD